MVVGREGALRAGVAAPRRRGIVMSLFAGPQSIRTKDDLDGVGMLGVEARKANKWVQFLYSTTMVIKPY